MRNRVVVRVRREVLDPGHLGRRAVHVDQCAAQRSCPIWAQVARHGVGVRRGRGGPCSGTSDTGLPSQLRRGELPRRPRQHELRWCRRVLRQYLHQLFAQGLTVRSMFGSLAHVFPPGHPPRSRPCRSRGGSSPMFGVFELHDADRTARRRRREYAPCRWVPIARRLRGPVRRDTRPLRRWTFLRVAR